jgi:hypothetical protein
MTLNENTNTFTITLTGDEFSQLLILLGYAVGAAFQNGNRQMAHSFLRLTNRINRDNRNYKPYGVPEDNGDPR